MDATVYGTVTLRRKPTLNLLKRMAEQDGKHVPQVVDALVKDEATKRGLNGRRKEAS